MTSQITFLKEIVVIMMGLSLTSTVQTFFSKYVVTNSSINFNSLPNYLIFILILLNIIRFFYGNWMNLDKDISPSINSINGNIDSKNILFIL